MQSSTSQSERLAFVRGLTLLADVCPDDCNTIISAAREQRWWRWQNILSSDDPVENVILLLSGCVKITQLDISGNEVILRLSGVGELLGSFHLLADRNHFSTAQAIHPSTALVWQLAAFERLLDSFPVFRRNVVGALEERLEEMEERFREVSTLNVGSRLGSELMRLLNRFGHEINGNREIHISQTDLAQLTGTTLSTVSRLLNRWQKLGIVSIGRGTVLVRDFDALARLSRGE